MDVEVYTVHGVDAFSALFVESVGAAVKGEAAILDLVLTWHSSLIAASLV